MLRPDTLKKSTGWKPKKKAPAVVGVRAPASSRSALPPEDIALGSDASLMEPSMGVSQLPYTPEEIASLAGNQQYQMAQGFQPQYIPDQQPMFQELMRGVPSGYTPEAMPTRDIQGEQNQNANLLRALGVAQGLSGMMGGGGLTYGSIYNAGNEFANARKATADEVYAQKTREAADRNAQKQTLFNTSFQSAGLKGELGGKAAESAEKVGSANNRMGMDRIGLIGKAAESANQAMAAGSDRMRAQTGEASRLDQKAAQTESQRLAQQGQNLDYLVKVMGSFTEGMTPQAVAALNEQGRAAAKAAGKPWKDFSVAAMTPRDRAALNLQRENLQVERFKINAQIRMNDADNFAQRGNVMLGGMFELLAKSGQAGTPLMQKAQQLQKALLDIRTRVLSMRTNDYNKVGGIWQSNLKRVANALGKQPSEIGEDIVFANAKYWTPAFADWQRKEQTMLATQHRLESELTDLAKAVGFNSPASVEEMLRLNFSEKTGVPYSNQGDTSATDDFKSSARALIEKMAKEKK